MKKARGLISGVIPMTWKHPVLITQPWPSSLLIAYVPTNNRGVWVFPGKALQGIPFQCDCSGKKRRPGTVMILPANPKRLWWEKNVNQLVAGSSMMI
jgi:hypothetical protein